MSVMGMRGARFIEGNDGSGADGKPGGEDSGEGSNNDASNEGEPRDEGKPEGGEKPEDGKPEGDEGEKPEDDFKSDESKKSLLADLRKARDDRNSLRTENEALTESITERDATIATKDAELAAKDSQIEVLKLAAAHHIEDESDIELLTSVTDADKRSNLAKRLATDARNRVNRRVGAGGGGAPASSLDAGRDLYESRKK
ncbi:hypothetical protein AOZ07_03050 [Glutamicibacter halophytocola]|nr:hypothetical protein AOZ07_03050 [Glutamicibacter halophytocola]